MTAEAELAERLRAWGEPLKSRPFVRLLLLRILEAGDAAEIMTIFDCALGRYFSDSRELAALILDPKKDKNHG